MNVKYRRWTTLAVLLLVTLVVASLTAIVGRHSTSDTTVAVQPYERAQTPIIPSVDSTATPTAHKREEIAPSTPTELFVPSETKSLEISARVKPMQCGTHIVPPLDGNVYSCADREQPGTTSQSMSVLAGHSSENPDLGDLAFNRLYVQGDSFIGRDIYVRTEESGAKLLHYRVQAVHTPLKEDLANLPIIPNGSKERWLVIVTCLQRGPDVPSVRNYVVVASLVGVTEASATS